MDYAQIIAANGLEKTRAFKNEDAYYTAHPMEMPVWRTLLVELFKAAPKLADQPALRLVGSQA